MLSEASSTTPKYIPFTIQASACDINEPSKEHPDDCHKFYECSPVEAGYDLVEKTCGSTMFYNPQSRTCDWPESVIAIKGSCAEKPVNRNETVTQGGKCIPDFIRTRTEDVFFSVTLCPPGTVYDSCAIHCDRLCLHYSYLIHEKGLCRGENKCESGCISEVKQVECPKGYLWLDENTCVSVDECVCVTETGEPMKVCMNSELFFLFNGTIFKIAKKSNGKICHKNI